MKKTINSIVFLLITYPLGILLGIIFRIFWVLGKIRVLHWERFPHYQGKLILISNHLSLLEPILLPALFFREYLFHPFKWGPWSTPDQQNYYDRWYWFWLRPKAIPIERRDPGGKVRALSRMIKVLKSGGIIILFPEGGRTFKGEKFYHSPKGKRIRALERGLGFLAVKTQALIIPVWVEGTDKVLPNSPDRLYHTFPKFWRRITIKIGRPLRFDDEGDVIKRDKIDGKIRDALLQLADEEDPVVDI